MDDDPPAPDPRSRDGDAARSWLARAGLLLVAVVILRLAFEMWWVARIHEHLWTQLGVSLLYIAGAVFLFLAAARVRHERLDMAGFLTLCAAFGFYAAVTMQVMARHYTSDALLFVHQSSLLTLGGLNPYQHSLVAGYEALQVPYYVQTPTTSGGLISNFNYPALAFLAYTPFVALGLTDLRPVSAAFFVATLGLLFLATPRHLRLLALSILFLSSFFLSFSLAGFDIVYVFFLLAAAILLKHSPAAAMIAYGASAAVKQPVWFIAPFLLVYLWQEAPAGSDRRARLVHVARHATLATAAFLVPNAWFIVHDPGAWFAGVFTPLGGSGDVLVPLSQGATIPFYTGTWYVAPFLLTLLSLSLLLLLLGLYWVRYPVLRDTLWVAPALILLVNARSLQNYYEMFYPILVVMLVATLPPHWTDEDEDDAKPQPEPTEGGPPAALETTSTSSATLPLQDPP